MITRTIPSTDERLAAIGLGTWQTFDAGPSKDPALTTVLKTMHAAGGRLLDTSPMYGHAEETIGRLTSQLPEQNDFFYATKVWTRGASAGIQQIEASYRLMKRSVMDLIQIHNLLDWSEHLPYLRKLKKEGRLRYLGITHYLDSSHNDLAELLKKEPFDFVQFNYSIQSRHAENYLLPLCSDKGVATLINRPLGQGDLFVKVAHQQLPPWAREVGVKSWSEFFLAFLLAHPAVTCVIPATGNPDHAAQNFASGDVLVDEQTRKRMVVYLEGLA